MPEDYYQEKLSANRLKKCYEVASPRIQQYLSAEIDFVIQRVSGNTKVLELGCGYGRVLRKVAAHVSEIVGIDTSQESLDIARDYLKAIGNCKLYNMNAVSLDFPENTFDSVFAIQNGISAFKVEPIRLVKESTRVTKQGGKVLLSSYSDKIWAARLEWFQKQSEMGLLGEIDYTKTKDGTIICNDGFRATTYSRTSFRRLVTQLKLSAEIIEVDNSSIFCVISV